MQRPSAFLRWHRNKPLRTKGLNKTNLEGPRVFWRLTFRSPSLFPFVCLCAQPLKGEKLRAQVRKWAEYGTIEPSARDAIEYLIDNPKALDLSDKVPPLCLVLLEAFAAFMDTKGIGGHRRDAAIMGAGW